jgi:hypothetical protein
MKPGSCSAASSCNGTLLLLSLAVLLLQLRGAVSDGRLVRVVDDPRRLIPFHTSNLTCLDAWTSQGFIVRVRLRSSTNPASSVYRC